MPPMPRRQRGQIVVLFVIGLMALVLLLSLVFNTGQQIDSRIRVQNAVDAAAISQATAVARSLNVMSMNNVAITQGFTLNVLMTALLPVLSEATVKAGVKAFQYSAGILANCPPCFSVVGAAACPACIFNTVRLVDLVIGVLVPLINIWGDLGINLGISNFKVDPDSFSLTFPPKYVQATADVTLSLDDMNKTLATEFFDTSKTMAADLAGKNGLAEAPRFFPGAAFPAGPQGDYAGTVLPVARTSPVTGLLNLASIPDSQDQSLCLTSYLASPVNAVGQGPYWNFQQHGYDFRKGPYKIGKAQFEATIDPPVAHLEGGLQQTNVVLDFVDNLPLDAIFVAACATEYIFNVSGGLTALAKPVEHLDIYKINKSWPIKTTNTDDWTILALAREKQATGALGGEEFVHPFGSQLAYAQAQVYNLVFFDLYTQDWQAKLVPASQISDSARRQDIASKLENDPDYKKFAAVLKNLKDTEADRFNVH